MCYAFAPQYKRPNTRQGFEVWEFKKRYEQDTAYLMESTFASDELNERIGQWKEKDANGDPTFPIHFSGPDCDVLGYRYDFRPRAAA